MLLKSAEAAKRMSARRRERTLNANQSGDTSDLLPVVCNTCVMADKSKKESTPPPLLLMPAGGGLTLNPPEQPSFLMPVVQSEPSLLGQCGGLIRL